MKCTSRHRHHSLSGRVEVIECELETPHQDEPPYGFAAKGCHRSDGHFWSDEDSVPAAGLADPKEGTE